MTNATEQQIYDALHLRLDALLPRWSLKHRGVDFSPGAAPWMRMTMLPTPEPEFTGFGNGRFTRQTRLMQIDLFYPKAEKRTDFLLQRADAVRALFWDRHGLFIQAGQATLDILKEPVIGPLIETGPSHLQIDVTVVFSTDRSPGG